MPRNPIWVEESPFSAIEGEVLAFSVDYQGATTVDTITVEVFKNGSGTDYAASVFVSGDSHTSAGNVAVLKKLTAADGDGDNSYVVVIQANVDGNTQKRKLRINVINEKSES